jgi:hypothetical protein
MAHRTGKVGIRVCCALVRCLGIVLVHDTKTLLKYLHFTAQKSPKGTSAACQPTIPAQATVVHRETHSPAEPQTDQDATWKIQTVPLRVLGRAPP